MLGAIGALLVAAPDFVLDAWPWPLTELLSRVIGGWYLFSAATLGFASLALRRPHEVPIPYVTVATWSALLLPLPGLYSASVEAGPSLAAYLIVHALVTAVCAYAAVGAWRGMRAQGGSL